MVGVTVPWQAIIGMGSLMVLICGLLTRILIRLGRFIEGYDNAKTENSKDHVKMDQQLKVLDFRVNRIHHRTTSMIVAGTQTATLLAYPTSPDSPAERKRNIDDWKRLLSDETL